jgi:hypothetical protein
MSTNLKTYLKSSRPTSARGEPSSHLVPSRSRAGLSEITNRSAVASSPLGNKAPKRKIEEDDGIENEIHRSASVNDLDQTVELQRNRIKRAGSLEDHISQGHPEDVKRLLECIESINASGVFFQLHNHAYVDYEDVCKSSSNPDRFFAWLRRVGFQEEGRGLKIIWKLPASKVSWCNCNAILF